MIVELNEPVRYNNNNNNHNKNNNKNNNNNKNKNNNNNNNDNIYYDDKSYFHTFLASTCRTRFV